MAALVEAPLPVLHFSLDTKAGLRIGPILGKGLKDGNHTSRELSTVASPGSE
jgi:hypothetical protein